jgi:hypothetical protein
MSTTTTPTLWNPDQGEAMRAQLGLISGLADVIGMVTMTLDYDTLTPKSLDLIGHLAEILGEVTRGLRHRDEAAALAADGVSSSDRQPAPPGDLPPAACERLAAVCIAAYKAELTSVFMDRQTAAE